MLDLEGWFLQKIAAAQVRLWPFPHCFIENVLPVGLYEDLRVKIDREAHFRAGRSNTTGRAFGYDVDFPELALLRGPLVMANLCWKFGIDTEDREFAPWMLTQDAPGFALGPHTDFPHRLVTCMFYLPRKNHQHREGTHLYRPLSADFACAINETHPFDSFETALRIPFLRNSCLIFPRTNNSFHGVPLKTSPEPRRILSLHLENPKTRPENCHGC